MSKCLGVLTLLKGYLNDTNFHPLFRTTDDGNNLFNACSIAPVGDESLSVCLRALTCIEIYLNAQFYASHTALAGLTKETAFLKCFSADVPGTRSNRLSAVFAEAVASARNYRYSSFLCLLGLSSVIKLPIESYYPIAEEGQSDDLISTESICNCTVYPRVIDDRSEHKIHIFRCAGKECWRISRLYLRRFHVVSL